MVRLRTTASALVLASTAHLLTASCLLADIHYVWTNSPSPLAPHSNWTTAAHVIQDAVDAAADGDTVLVTNGVYDTGGRAQPGYSLTNRVMIGGPLTVCSVNGARVTSILGTGPVGDGAIRCVYLGTNATLRGFTLTNGHTRRSGDWYNELCAGGALCETGAVISMCLLIRNEADQNAGGASHGTLLDCTISSNSAVYGVGGGVFEARLDGCRVVANSAYGSGGGMYYCTASNSLIALNTSRYSSGGGAVGSQLCGCVVSNNVARSSGGGGDHCSFADCLLVGNKADGGGGAYWSKIWRCIVMSNTATGDGGGAYGWEVHASAICGNSAGRSGGGVYRGSLSNCSVAQNSATNAGGGTWGANLTNCVVYGNTASSGSNWYLGTIIYSCTTPLPPGVGNISKSPAFVDVARLDLRLAGSSPCIDAGRNGVWMYDAIDLGGNPRLFNHKVDMGAYEFTMRTEMDLFLQGPYRTNGMAASLRDRLPLAAPYAADTREAAAIPSNVTDWVLLELAETNTERVVAAKGAFLRHDGQAVDEQGSPGIRLECSPGYYLLTAKHRNHLAATSAQPIAYTNPVVTFDFTSGPDKYLGGTNACVELEPGIWGLIAGDADGDGRITPTDRKVVEQQMGKTGYLSGDLNLDGKVDGED